MYVDALRGRDHHGTERRFRQISASYDTDRQHRLRSTVCLGGPNQCHLGWKIYSLTQCRLRYFNGKCQPTTKTTTVTEAKTQDFDT